jgi:hypothetical protein
MKKLARVRTSSRPKPAVLQRILKKKNSGSAKRVMWSAEY